MYDQTPEIKPATAAVPWNKGKLIGQKPPLTLKQIWAIRIRLQMDHRVRDLALFNLAIDSKLRGCDLVRLRVRDVVHGDQVVSRATVMQRKTGQPVRFEVTEQTRDAVQAWIAERKLYVRGLSLSPAGSARLTAISPPDSTRGSCTAGSHDRAGPRRVRDALDAPDQGNADLPAHEEPASRSAAARALQTGVDRAIPRYRGR